jgi:hypothetical protein
MEGGSHELFTQVHDIVDKYEELSETICEMCGKPGILRTDRPWISTLCDKCKEELDNKKQPTEEENLKTALELAARLRRLPINKKQNTH